MYKTSFIESSVYLCTIQGWPLWPHNRFLWRKESMILFKTKFSLFFPEPKIHRSLCATGAFFKQQWLSSFLKRNPNDSNGHLTLKVGRVALSSRSQAWLGPRWKTGVKVEPWSAWFGMKSLLLPSELILPFFEKFLSKFFIDFLPAAMQQHDPGLCVSNCCHWSFPGMTVPESPPQDLSSLLIWHPSVWY